MYTNLQEIMGCESSDVLRFDLEPRPQGKTRTAKFKVLITRLLLILEVWDVKPTCRISWAGNLLKWSYLNLGPSRSNDGSQNLVSCLSGAYKFALVLRCVGLVLHITIPTYS